jgi:hypothetical protein
MTTNKRPEKRMRSSVPPFTPSAPSNAELEEKLEAFERKFDEKFRLAFDAIRKLRDRRSRPPVRTSEEALREGIRSHIRKKHASR